MAHAGDQPDCGEPWATPKECPGGVTDGVFGGVNDTVTLGVLDGVADTDIDGVGVGDGGLLQSTISVIHPVLLTLTAHSPAGADTLLK